MEKYEIIKLTDGFGHTTEHVIVDHGNNEFTSYCKAQWDELQAQRELGGTL